MNEKDGYTTFLLVPEYRGEKKKDLFVYSLGGVGIEYSHSLPTKQ